MDENCMDYVHLTNDKILGNHKWKGKLDLLNVVLIGITKEVPKQDEKYELHRLLAALFSEELSVNEKLNIMETEYHIPLEDNTRKDVSVMCNLSEGVFERGEAKGEAKGEARGKAIGEAKIILNMNKKGYTIEQIADVTDKDVEEIKAIIENREPALV
jgi:predicted transposase YdaD